MIAVNSGQPIWTSYNTGARQAAEQARLLYGQLRQLQIEAARTNDPKLLSAIQQKARDANAEIERLETKMQRVVAGRTAAADRLAGTTGIFGLLGGANANERYSRLNLARQGGDVFTSAAMGMNPAMIAIQQGPQILEAMSTSGIALNKALIASAAVS